MAIQFSLKKAFTDYVNNQYPPSVDTFGNSTPNSVGTSIKNNFWVNVILFVLEYAPLISGIGAVCYTTSSIISADIFSILVNRNIMILFNIIIGICGVVTVLEWVSLDILLSFSLTSAKIVSGNINL